MAASWFEEMKQRRVFRALVGYGIVSFGVLQLRAIIGYGVLAFAVLQILIEPTSDFWVHGIQSARSK